MKTLWKVLLGLLAAGLVIGGGAYLYANSKIATNNETPTSSTSTQSTTTDPTAGWKTQTNTKYGYSFKYPADATVTGITGQEGLPADPAVASAVSVFAKGAVVGTENTNALFSVSLYGFEATADSIKEHLGASASTTVATVIAGKSGFKYVNPGDTSTLYFLTNSAGDSLEIAVKNDNIDAINMFNSFQLTTTDATTDWKTYTNTTYSFSFQYPPTWTINEMDVAKNPQLQEPWKSFEFYVDYTPPGASDHYGYIGISKKSPSDLIAQEWVGTPNQTNETVTFAGSSATKFTAGFNDAPAADTEGEYYVIKGGHTFAVTRAQSMASFSDAQKSLWEQVDTLVNSFRFTN